MHLGSKFQTCGARRFFRDYHTLRYVHFVLTEQYRAWKWLEFPHSPPKPASSCVCELINLKTLLEEQLKHSTSSPKVAYKGSLTS